MHFDFCSSFFKYLRIEKAVDGFIRKDKISKKIYKVKFFILKHFKIVRQLYNQNNEFFILYMNREKKLNKKCIEKKIIKLYHQLNKEIILSKELIEILRDTTNETIKMILKYNFEDKTIYKNKILEISSQVINEINPNFQNENMYILLNEYSYKYYNLIYQLSTLYKCLNIVTCDIKSFKSLENSLFENNEIAIVTTNNKRKALRNAKYIINIDFDERALKKYSINRKSIIFNVSANKIKYIRGFDGIIVNNVELDDKFDGNSKYYLYSRFKNYSYNINKEIKVKKIVGNNTSFSCAEILFNHTTYN